MKKYLLIILLLCIGCTEVDKDEKYLNQIDPNDQILSGLLRPSDDWIAKFGYDERSVLIYNISLNNIMNRRHEEKLKEQTWE